MQRLLSTSNAKTVKGEKRGYYTSILYLAPHKLSGLNVCAKASEGCSKACLNTAGRGAYSRVQEARIRKTRLFFSDVQSFVRRLIQEVGAHKRASSRMGLIPCIRLNGTSDIKWENLKVDGYNIFEHHQDVQFYDYTKIVNRKRYANYHLTFSLSESNDEDAKRALESGMNLAVVFRELPGEFLGLPVIAGDEDDLRFLDPPNCVVGLLAKGKAKKDVSGFVR